MVRKLLSLSVLLIGAGVARLSAQAPVASEVRQIVTFAFLPERSAEALGVFRDEAIPLYENDEAMRSFRGFREVESPIPLDLIVVSAFEGMAGMDDSNAALRTLAEKAGSSIGEIYGRIGALTSGHTDEFIEMLPGLGTGDPMSRRLTTFVWYRVVPGQADAFERALETAIVPWEAARRVPSATGRFLVSDGWHYLRFLGFDSLAEYQDYWSRIAEEADYGGIEGLIARRREAIVASVEGLSVR